MSENETMSREDLLAKLKRISGLYQKTQEIQYQMDNFQPEDHYERKVAVPMFPGDFQSEKERKIWTEQLDHTDENAPKIAELTHRKIYGPKEPEKPKHPAFEKPEDRELQRKQSKFGGLSKLSAGVAIFFLLGTLINLNDEYDVLPVLITITLIAAAAFLLCGFIAKTAKAQEEKKIAEAQAVYNRQKEERMAQYEKQKKAYEAECAEYEEILQKFLEDYDAWREIFLQSVNEEEDIAHQLEQDRESAVHQIYEEKMLPAMAALNEENDLVSDDYLPNLNVIMDLLKSQRADNLKEAINLYEEILYRERQLELEREKEAQRQYEEQQRQEAEERRYREEKQFRESQERQRQREEEQRRQDEERRYREETRAREAEARSRELQERERRRKEEYKAHMSRVEEERNQRSAGQAQCRACANVGRCNMSVYNKAPNCTGFTPRR